jgi:hypothetical protein
MQRRSRGDTETDAERKFLSFLRAFLRDLRASAVAFQSIGQTISS